MSYLHTKPYPSHNKQSAYRAIMLLPIRVLDYAFSITTVFPSTLPVVSGMPFLKPSADDYDEATGTLKQLFILDYRYTRFAVDPRTGLFSLIRYVRPLANVNLRLIVIKGIGEILTLSRSPSYHQASQRKPSVSVRSSLEKTRLRLKQSPPGRCSWRRCVFFPFMPLEAQTH